MRTLVSFIFIIGVLVTIHELGHFLAARLVGVHVEKFYIGFNVFGYGWKRVINETEYGIGWLPLGGYVKIPGMDESEETIGYEESQLFHQTKWTTKVYISLSLQFVRILQAEIAFSSSPSPIQAVIINILIFAPSIWVSGYCCASGISNSRDCP